MSSPIARGTATAGRSPFRAKALTLAAAAALATAVLPASAAAASAQPFGYAPVGLASVHGSQWASSSPWGGYVATGSGFRSIVGSWTEPPVTCTSRNNLFAPWVGIDGYGSQTVEQTGAQVSCSSGRAVYSAWYEMYPANPVYLSNPVAAGDSFTGSVTTTGNGSYKISLSDNTQGWTYNTTQRLSAQNVSAEAIIESPTSSYPKFTATSFSGITVNGNTFSAYNPIPLSSGGYSPTALNGGSFSLVP
ncbi:hypothetical protein GXW83_06735 [Streptacidiphilus sp. PB12-B1b]|uniref:G1 family glutamic endopeptidase n=1 Tax=Streptacidiphilus sp. PB12-B1b TaxID=2705012 RepID=UPI0015FC2EB1|nr:G1 family glutamic endopeptidase [Streptacidiphilus sp. PB12-B1b]QMU75485.1 hypothetical protein GXW83_06735 [Streptacidiphilus sp. PB12-B1b]